MKHFWLTNTRRFFSKLHQAHQLWRRHFKNLVWEPYLQQLTDTSVVILWATHRDAANATVRYSLDTNYGSVARGRSRPVDALRMQLHRVELTGLQPNTTYYYKIYVAGRGLLPNKVFSFQTAPPVGSNTPFTFIAFGDYGNNTMSQWRLRDQMLRDSFNFILTTGDNSQGYGTYKQYDSRVLQIYRDIFSKSAFFPTMGNHDYMTNNGAPYLDIFDLPRNTWHTPDLQRYYSFDYGNVHFIVLDSNILCKPADGSSSEEMLKWFRCDLSQTTQPWKIVTCHHPPYNTGGHGSDERVQTKLVPIFQTYGVDLVMSGHQHNYQRSQPLWNGQVTTVAEGGIVYVVSGAGAAARHPCNGADWLACSISSVSYGLYNRITASRDRLIIEAVDDGGRVKDTCTLSKG